MTRGSVSVDWPARVQVFAVIFTPSSQTLLCFSQKHFHLPKMPVTDDQPSSFSLIFLTFHSENILDLLKSCKNNAECSHKPFSYLRLRLALCVSRVQLSKLTLVQNHSVDDFICMCQFSLPVSFCSRIPSRVLGRIAVGCHVASTASGL